jgi:ribonuclease HII
MSLRPSFTGYLTEAGCDEAGRGCLAGPVCAAAVILPFNFSEPLLNDSKQLTPLQRLIMRRIILNSTLAWAVEMIDNEIIDEINILNASILAMHRALDKLSVRPELIIVDGKSFHPYSGINHRCIVKGDAKYQSIAAASILAKTYRDEYMEQLDQQFPQYGWRQNKGYPTPMHRSAIRQYGLCTYHRRSFKLKEELPFFQGSSF